MSPCEKSLYILKLQCVFQLSWINAVILYGIGITHYICMLKSRNRPVHPVLHILRHRAAHAVYIHFICIFSLRLDKYLMMILFSELYHLILDGRAVPGTGGFNNPCIKRRTIQIFTYYFMSFLIGISKITWHLFYLHILGIRGKREGYYRHIPLLDFHFGKIDASLVDSCRCSRLKPGKLNSIFSKGIGKIICCLQSVWSRIVAYISVNATGLKVYAGTYNYCLGLINCP